jgi:beta-glucuronidase
VPSSSGSADLPLRDPSAPPARRGAPTLRSRVLYVLAGLLLLSLLAASEANPGGVGGGGRSAAALPGAVSGPGSARAAAYTGSSPHGGEAGGYGPAGRYELGGSWLFRFDHGVGLSRGFESSTSKTGWSAVTVPNAWNATDQSAASMAGTVGWYRKDFELPEASTSAGAQPSWIVRLESVNNRVQAWLNGRPIGSHSGAYLPFELVLPGALLRAHGVNHLVLRVDSRRRIGDFPGSGLFWNYGGILRKVYLQRVDRIGFTSVQVLPRLACATCDATIEYRVMLRSYASIAENVHLSGSYGPLAVDLGTATIAAGATRTFEEVVTLPHPRLWSPQSPWLYEVALDAAVGQGGGGQEWTEVGHYRLRSGVRSIQVSPEGTLLLNGRRLNFRGVGLIEDSRQLGGAIDEATERRYIAEIKEVGATAVRSQYPLDQQLEELADENGIMLWSEIPVDQVPSRYLAIGSVRSRALGELRANILANSSHPSIVIWSIANELAPEPDRFQGAYIAGAVAEAHALDPTRPVGLAVAAYPSAGCQARYYAPLDVIGLNDYFGWYPGPVGDLRNRNGLSGYLDAMRRCYAGKGIVVTEFGAEANRPGPAGERGTYAFQQEFVRFHLDVFATKPWLGGALYWALEEFRVRPGWGGGNPRPSPPIHAKGLISFAGRRKPAFYEAQRLYRSTQQVGAP